MNRCGFLAAALFGLLLGSGQRLGWSAEEFPVPPPPLSESYFPCSQSGCHDASWQTNRTPRELGEHTDIELHHAEQFRWCLDCHDAQDRDMLHLQSGERIPFTESYRLCGQCHGDKYRDWRNGIHGKRTGLWNGKKEYLLCAHCHNPHSPRFKALKPEPPPLVPGTGTLRAQGPAGGGLAERKAH